MQFNLNSFMFLFITLCYGQNAPITPNAGLDKGLTDKLGNFSIELLYHTSVIEPKNTNLLLSPITLWTVLAVTAEGSVGVTRKQINNVIRVTTRDRLRVHSEYKDITKWLKLKTNTISHTIVNSMFVDIAALPLNDFIVSAKSDYNIDVISLDFSQPDLASEEANRIIANVTHGKTPKLVESNYFSNSRLLLTSAAYFKEQWTIPFNASATRKSPFYDSDGKHIGEVNMMHNTDNYAMAVIPEMQATILELPYGTDNILSMVIMLPEPGVSVEGMIINFNNFRLDEMFLQLKNAREKSDGLVSCELPRFKAESNIDLTRILRDRLGVVDLFDGSKARLNLMARLPLYVSKVIHKCEIEVTEKGTETSGGTASVDTNGFAVSTFTVNRPFSYLIIEKITNTIVFSGIFREPSLF